MGLTVAGPEVDDHGILTTVDRVWVTLPEPPHLSGTRGHDLVHPIPWLEVLSPGDRAQAELTEPSSGKTIQFARTDTTLYEIAFADQGAEQHLGLVIAGDPDTDLLASQTYRIAIETSGPGVHIEAELIAHPPR